MSDWAGDGSSGGGSIKAAEKSDSFHNEGAEGQPPKSDGSDKGKAEGQAEPEKKETGPAADSKPETKAGGSKCCLLL
jgi:hypothetical protein